MSDSIVDTSFVCFAVRNHTVQHHRSNNVVDAPNAGFTSSNAFSKSAMVTLIFSSSMGAPISFISTCRISKGSADFRDLRFPLAKVAGASRELCQVYICTKKLILAHAIRVNVQDLYATLLVRQTDFYVNL